MDATSTTVSTEVVPVSAVVDTYEERDLAVFFIPGAYLRADIDDYMFMIFCVTMV